MRQGEFAGQPRAVRVSATSLYRSGARGTVGDEEQEKVDRGTFLTLDGVMQAPGGADEDREGGFLECDVAAEVAKLEAREGGEIQVHGSSDVLQALLERDLADTLRIWPFPVVVGTGKRSFGEVEVGQETVSFDSDTARR